MRVYTASLGCKLNQSEMESLADRLARAGHQVVASPAEADLCILNTCAVTHVAAQKSRQALRRLNRENPAARLVVTGCYAELAPADLRDLPGVELLAGNREKDGLAELLANLLPGAGAAPDPRPAPGRTGSRTRALVKIQDGCDNACTYCIIHVARGPQRSRPFEQVLEEVRARLVAGYQEIVLTGVHIGAYGRDRAAPPARLDLWALVGRILSETDVPRLRLSSIEPWDLPAGAFALWQDARLCPHLHLPLQSGSDATLRRMGRRYTFTQFRALVDSARAAVPDLAVTTDVIVGFPGETGDEFAAGLSTVRAAQFARLHVFPFSPRPGTPAAAMADPVPPSVREERARDMRAVGAAAERAFRERFVGRTMDVLWEACRPGAGGPRWSGLTGNYLRVHTTAAEDLANRLLPARLAAGPDGELYGHLEAQKSGG